MLRVERVDVTIVVQEKVGEILIYSDLTGTDIPLLLT